MSPSPPSSDRHQILGTLAAGGMASIHLARLRGDAGFSRLVVIKQLHEHFADDPELVNMLLDEGRMASRVVHPNIVSTLDVVHEHGELFLVMELVTGLSLAEIMQRAFDAKIRVPPAIAVAIAVGMLRGLHAVHEARDDDDVSLRMVHRDVSPHNVLIGEEGIPRIADFGIAKANGRTTKTHDGQIKGKIAYMAPEQLRAEVDVDRRVDLWATGVVLWEMLVGGRLFGGASASVIQAVLITPLPSLKSRLPGVPDELNAVVARALSRDRASRWSSAQDMADALERAVRPALASEVGAWISRVAKNELEARRRRVAELSRRPSAPPPALGKKRAIVDLGLPELGEDEDATEQVDVTPQIASNMLRPSSRPPPPIPKASRQGGLVMLAPSDADPTAPIRIREERSRPGSSHGGLIMLAPSDADPTIPVDFTKPLRIPAPKVPILEIVQHERVPVDSSPESPRARRRGLTKLLLALAAVGGVAFAGSYLVLKQMKRVNVEAKSAKSEPSTTSAAPSAHQLAPPVESALVEHNAE